MNVSVTYDDIHKGALCSSHECAVARAIRRDVPTIERVGVYPIFIKFKTTDGRFGKARTPHVVAEFIRNYDNQIPVKPIKFSLEEANTDE